jgi:signal peptidase I
MCVNGIEYMRPNALAEWVFNIIVLVFATSTIAQPYVIPSGSMESTLMTGDHVIVDKLAYSPHDSLSARLLPYEDVKRGDIIVFRYPVDIRETLVKRVVGMPGDRIRLVDGDVYRNGVKVEEKFAQHIFRSNGEMNGYRDNFPAVAPNAAEVFPQGMRMLNCCVSNGEIVVPAGHYFAMGDNRDNSSDSRYWGFVPRENIIGKPVLVWWSYDAGGSDLTDVVNVHHVLDLATHFFSKTRWERTMKLVRGS